MTSIAQQMQKISSENRLGLMTHIVIGYPDVEQSKDIVLEMANAGVDFVELQIPFTDPIADGPTIMQASTAALQNGVNTEKCFEVMRDLSLQVDVPLLFMTYYNMIHSWGPLEFCQKASEAGAKGLIVPDMPLDEEQFEGFYDAAETTGMPIICVLAPENSEARLKEVSDNSNSILYLPSRSGVTGATSELAQHLNFEVGKIKKVTEQPVAIGFGVSTGQHIETIKMSNADIAVVGSALIDRFESSGIPGVRAMLSELSTACRS
ncbi:tryptophan synthase subunit alpha [Pseudovibrio ascidiaceicola]|uniref:tryptophan synthase subunit alpha n=1 Tax=Pseudovibrio ascidiaceicola TaxID=285279 RepID=UPI003D360B5B